MPIIDFNPDEAEWVGDEQDGCYVQTQYVDGMDEGDCDEGWYVTVVVDSETGSFVEDLHTDAGPFATKDEAEECGVSWATDWCLTNSVNWNNE